MRQTLKYKGCYVHLSYDPNNGYKEFATVQIFNGHDFFTKHCKNFRSAQIFITKFLKNIDGGIWTWNQWIPKKDYKHE